MMIKTRAFIRAALAVICSPGVAGTGGPAHAMHAHLVTGFNKSPTDETVWADCVEATYDGYAPQPVVPPTGQIDSTGSCDGVCGMLTWIPTGNVTPEIVLAVVYTDATVGGVVLGIDQLDNPVPMDGANTGFSLVPVIDEPWEESGKPPSVVQ